jgi:hypothetical protein
VRHHTAVWLRVARLFLCLSINSKGKPLTATDPHMTRFMMSVRMR